MLYAGTYFAETTSNRKLDQILLEYIWLIEIDQGRLVVISAFASIEKVLKS